MSKLKLASVCLVEPVRTRGQSARTIELIKYARRLLEEDNPQTLRQPHYAIFSRNEIDYDNNKAGYDRLGRGTSKARRDWREWELAGEIGEPPELGINPLYMIDETREAEEAYMFENAQEALRIVQANYRRDLWQDQPNYCEIWCEKATILGSLRPIKNEWGVTLQVSHGFSSTTMEDRIGRRFEALKARGKNIHVFYLGDHDPSGRDIKRNLAAQSRTASGVKFKVHWLAINPEDIQKFNLPPQRIKNTDTRARKFRKEFNRRANTVELEALPVAELRRRVVQAIKRLTEFGEWNRQLHIQQQEIDSMAGILDIWPTLKHKITERKEVREGTKHARS